ncbi:glycosyltransferase [Arthrobacter citreus]|uniref:Glycosyltransferase n=1 Tax=Arthrobacter citreus TaxID=1670 RepID=A0ABZ2ZR76_9MICC
MAAPKIAVVIPTLTSPTSLERLLLSLAKQTLPPVEVVVVAQKQPETAALIIASAYPSARMVTSSIGLSKARNAGIYSLVSDWDVVALPDDDIEYSLNAFENAAAHFISDLGAICGRVSPEDPSEETRIAFGTEPIDVNKKNVWSTTIEAGYFLSRHMMDRIGSYNEDLGLGAASQWKSGEGTEVLLRAIEGGFRVRYQPDVSMIEITDRAKQQEHDRKRLRDYARGTGRVYRLRYGLLGQAELVIRSVGRLTLRGLRSRGSTVRDDWAILSGRVQGLLG